MLQNFEFARGESSNRVRLSARRRLQLRIEHGFSRRHRFTAAHQIQVHGIFQNVAARAGIQGLAHQRFLGVHAEHQNQRSRRALENLAGGLQCRSCPAERNP